MAEDDIVHLIDDPGDKPPEQGPRWKIAVIDDEPAVHDGTRFALSDYRLNGQGLEILSAYSAADWPSNPGSAGVHGFASPSPALRPAKLSRRRPHNDGQGAWLRTTSST